MTEAVDTVNQRVSRATTAVNQDSLVSRLLDAAEAEIIERGTSDVSLRAIARRAGVSHQAPGYAFDDRAGLLAALGARGYRLLVGAIIDARERLGPEASGLERLAEMGLAYVLAAAARPALFRLMTRSDLSDTRNELGTARKAAIDALLQVVHEAMDEGWHAGEPAESVAALCWAAVHGLAVLYSDGSLQHLLDAPLQTVARDAIGNLIRR